MRIPSNHCPRTLGRYIPFMIEYVIVHELVQLIEPNHTATF